MARAPFVVRNNGRYFFHKRFSSSRTVSGCPTHLRLSLRTADYREAVERMLRVVRMLHLYESDDGMLARSQYLVAELTRLNSHPSGCDASTLVERHSLEVLVNRFITEARFTDYELETDPQFWPTWMTFVNINAMVERAVLPPAEVPAGGDRRAPGRSDLGEVAVAPRQRRPPETRSSIPTAQWTEEGSATGHEWVDVEAGLPMRTTPLKERAEELASPVPPSALGESFPAPLPTAVSEKPLPSKLSSETSAITIVAHVDELELHRDAPLSIMARGYLNYRRSKDGDGRAEEDAGIVLQFAIDLLGNLALSSVQPQHLSKIENALIDIPKTTGIPSPHRDSLHGRWLYARQHGWEKLQRVGETRIRNAWHRCLHQFFDWAREKTYYAGPTYKFALVGSKNPEAGERDAWRDDELIRFFSLPLFTGSWSSAHIWKAGGWLVQSYLYWAYLITFLTGMRPSEIAKLQVSQVVQLEDIWYFDLRKKRSAAGAEDQPKLKRRSSHRLIPIHPLLIDLGLLERREALDKQGEVRLFPDSKIYLHKKSGREMWGHEHSKSWQYVKKKFGFDREALTLYGGRHTVATWYDEAGIPQRIRNRLLGHAPRSTADGYGAIDLTHHEAKLAMERKNPVEEKIAEILITAKLRADYGELEFAKAW